MWNQKESGLLKDLKGQEQLCVDKYMRHAEKAHDPQLKNLFSYLAQQEAQHLRTVTEMEQGTVPQMNGGSQQQNSCTPGDPVSFQETVTLYHRICHLRFHHKTPFAPKIIPLKTVQ